MIQPPHRFFAEITSFAATECKKPDARNKNPEGIVLLFEKWCIAGSPGPTVTARKRCLYADDFKGGERDARTLRSVNRTFGISSLNERKRGGAFSSIALPGKEVKMRARDILSVYSSGLCELVLTALGVAVVTLMVMQVISQAMGLMIDAEAILLFTWQCAVLMGLWPGQTFWTIRRRSSCGFEHSVIGVPSDDDMRIENHRRARQTRR